MSEKEMAEAIMELVMDAIGLVNEEVVTVLSLDQTKILLTKTYRLVKKIHKKSEPLKGSLID